MNGQWKKYFMAAMIFTVVVGSMAVAHAQYWTSFDDNTRYLALGDSLSAGYGAHPATNGFVYRLYESGAIDNVNNVLLNNIGVVNATSSDVLAYELPLGHLFFSNTGQDYRKVVTITVGGNDLQELIGTILYSGLTEEEIQILVGQTLYDFSLNLGDILGDLISDPDVEVYVANQYDPMLPVAGGSEIVSALNNAVDGVITGMKTVYPCANITLVDIYSAFEGRNGLLLIEKKGAEMFQVHPTNAGHRVMAGTFAEAIRGNAGFLCNPVDTINSF